MRDAEKTVGNMIDKEKPSLSVRWMPKAFPTSRPCCKPAKGRAQTHLPINEHLVDARFAISQK